MKMKFLLFFTSLLCLPLLGAGTEVVRSENKNNEVVYGVCRQNLQWVKSDVPTIADHIVDSYIPLVRISGRKARLSSAEVSEFINTFYAKGVKVHIVIPMHEEMFPIGYEKVEGPNFKVPKMSEIELDRFKLFIDEFIQTLAQNTDPRSIVGIELFNEPNWCDFNGDLPSYASNDEITERDGRIFTLQTSLDNPLFRDAYKGIEVYGQCLKLLREAMDKYFTHRDVKLVSAGLVSGGKWNGFRWEISQGYTKVLPEMFFTLLQGLHPDQKNSTNYLNYVDALGIHCYPPIDEGPLQAVMLKYYFNPIDEILLDSKPYWVTEWGFARPMLADKGGETQRLRSIREFIEAIADYGNVELATFYEFDATSNHNIWEDGKLLESGVFFKELYDKKNEE